MAFSGTWAPGGTWLAGFAQLLPGVRPPHDTTHARVNGRWGSEGLADRVLLATRITLAELLPCGGNPFGAHGHCWGGGIPCE
jgi:hypothetical protein